MTTCIHCERTIELDDDNSTWIDPEATGDDEIWRETCDAHDTFTAEHEPDEDGPADDSWYQSALERAAGPPRASVDYYDGGRLRHG
jgi:hypothetical protein